MAFIPLNIAWSWFPRFCRDKVWFHHFYLSTSFLIPFAYVYGFAHRPDYAVYSATPLFTYKWYIAKKLKSGEITEQQYHKLLHEAGYDH